MASRDEQRFISFANQVDEVQAGELDPQAIDIDLVNTCLTRIRAIERLRPNPPALKHAFACLRDEIDTQLQTHLQLPDWNESVRTEQYDRLVGMLDSFLENGRENPEDLPHVAACLRKVVEGFVEYRKKTHR